MYESIIEKKPTGATHWQAGTYYKLKDNTWYWHDNGNWVFCVGNVSVLTMTPLVDL